MRRLRKEDKQIVMDLIQSRIDANSKVCLSDNRINQDWVNDIMAQDKTYEETHRVFGLFDDDLETIFDINIRSGYYVVGMMISSKQATRKTVVLKDGYNPKSTALLAFTIGAMELEGFTRFYSMIPDHPRWKRAEKNPNRLTGDKYQIDEVLKIPANTLPTNDPTLDFEVEAVISRPFNIAMVVRRMTLKDSHVTA